MPKSLGAALLALLALVGLVAPARGADRLDRTVQYVRDNAGADCRRLAWPPRDLCTQLAGYDKSEQLMLAYEQSWTHRALQLQRALDDNVPFLRQLVPHTHNSTNSFAYPPTLTQTDSNQLYSVRDQLRMDMRSIEMDIHNAPYINDPRKGLDTVVLCHGTSVPVGPLVVHAGCSVDRPFTGGLAELRGWLMEPGNSGEIVLLYLENQLSDDAGAHDRAAADIESVIGEFVYRPPASAPCAPMPKASLTRAAIRAAGKQVLIVGNCDSQFAAWGSWVHERFPNWVESSSGEGDDYPDYPACISAERVAKRYDINWIRYFEDSTALSTADGVASTISAAEMRRMVRCGVNMPGFDRLAPDDARLAELVWSWAPDEPRSGAGSCAAHGPDARFRARSCADALPLACRSADGGWVIGAPCPASSLPGVPVNGFDNERLREAKVTAGAPAVFLAYRNLPGRGWTPTG